VKTATVNAAASLVLRDLGERLNATRYEIVDPSLTAVPSTRRNASLRLALASQVWGCSDGASRCPGPWIRNCPEGRGFACLLPVKSELSKWLIALVQLLGLQPACLSALPFAGSGFDFRLRSTLPRGGDTPPQGRGNVLLDSTYPT
jgi:hypothetical protein